jgi:glycosyltransferase involved in cell wall biosynthesis
MKILQLVKKVPFPLKDAEAIAVQNISRALVDMGCEIDLLFMNPSRQPFHGELPAAGFGHYRRVQKIEVDNRIKPLDAFLNLFTSKSYNVQRFESKTYEKALLEWLKTETYEVVLIETLFTTPYVDLIRQHSQALIVQRSLNVEHEIWQRMAANAAFGPKKCYLSLLAQRLKKYELAHLNDYDLMAAISSRDLAQFLDFGLEKPWMILPVALAPADYRPDWESLKTQPFHLGFIGSLDWRPNLEGLDWFIEQIWPGLQERFPDLEFRAAGRYMPERIKHMQVPGFIAVGEVEDAHAFVNAQAVMVSPLLSGSGLRVKILESMALGRVVLTTRMALEGIEAKDYEEVLIADELEEWIEKITWLRQNPDQALKIGHNARSWVENHVDRKVLMAQLLEKIKEIKGEAT